MKQFIFFVLLPLFMISANAQVPGFLGKKLMVGASLVCGSINFGGEPASATSVEKYPNNEFNHYGWSLHKYMKLSADLVITTHKAIALAYSSGYLGLKSEIDPNNWDVTYVITKLSVRTIDIGMKYHIKGNIAPLGSYINYGICYNTVTETDPANYYGQYNMPFTESKASFTGVYYGMGINYILKNIIVISTFFDMRLTNPLPFLDGLGADAVYGDLKRRAQARWQKGVYLNYGIGLGVLLF